MIVSSVGIGYQNRGPPPCTELGYGGGPGTTDHQMGLLITGAHLNDKGLDRGRKALPCIFPRHPTVVPFAGLVDDPQVLFYLFERRQGLYHRPVDGNGPLAPSEDEEGACLTFSLLPPPLEDLPSKGITCYPHLLGGKELNAFSPREHHAL